MVDFNAIVNAHAAAQCKAATPEMTKPVTPDMWTHRGWKIDFDAKPIPCRSFDWTATHPDYDASYEGPEDGWVSNGLSVSAGSYKELLAEIDCAQDDWEAENGQFGVEA